MSYEEIQTVADIIKDLKKCDPNADITVRGGIINIVQKPDNKRIYLDVRIAK